MSKKKLNKNKIITGWISKEVYKNHKVIETGFERNNKDAPSVLYISCFLIHEKRGKKADWEPEEWPPVKVTISVKFGDTVEP